MSTKSWIGGASVAQQVDHLTPGGTIEADDVFTVTLTDENGATQSVSAVAGGTTVADVCNALITALNNAGPSKNLFREVIWTTDEAKIIATARNPSKPFYCTVSTTEDGGGEADDQTFERTESVAHSGPNTWFVDANWEENAAPESGDDIRIMKGAHSILYGLETAGSGQGAQTFNSFIRGSQFHGSIGDPANGFYLMLDVEPNPIPYGPLLTINQTRRDTWISGNISAAARVVELARGTEVRLKTTDGALLATGSRVQGQITIASGSELSGVIRTLDCPLLRLTIEPNCTFTSNSWHRLQSGTIDLSSSLIFVEPSGATVFWRAGSLSIVDMIGGVVYPIGGGTVDLLSLFSGTWDYSQTKASHAEITGMDQYGGELILDRTEVATSGYTQFGGVKLGQFATS